MSVTNSLQAENTITESQLVSTDRPVEIKFEYTGSGDVPVVCEVQCWGNVDGLWTQVGSPLFANRRSETPATNPKFTLDFSDVIGRVIGDVFKKEYEVSGTTSQTWIPATDSIATTEQLNDSANPDAAGGTYCYFFATAWALNNAGVLERTDEEHIRWNPEGKYIVPVSVILPPSHLNTDSVFSNLLTNASTPKTIDGVVDARVHAYATQAGKKNYATNCPRGLRRKIPHGAPMALGILVYSKGSGFGFVSGVSVELAAGGTQVGDTSLNVPTTTPASGGAFFRTYLQSMSAIGALPASASSWNDLRPSFSMRLQTTSAPAGTLMDELFFELIEHPISNEVFRERSKMIYWINDFNCLDFLVFDGGTKISYKSTSTTYTTNKDFLSRRNTNRSTFRAQTEEIIEIKSPLLNKDGLDWLSEIGRSRRVFEYDFNAKDFVPINITKFKISSLDTERGANFAELTYIKDIISTK